MTTQQLRTFLNRGNSLYLLIGEVYLPVLRVQRNHIALLGGDLSAEYQSLSDFYVKVGNSYRSMEESVSISYIEGIPVIVQSLLSRTLVPGDLAFSMNSHRIFPILYANSLRELLKRFPDYWKGLDENNPSDKKELDSLYIAMSVEGALSIQELYNLHRSEIKLIEIINNN